MQVFIEDCDYLGEESGGVNIIVVISTTTTQANKDPRWDLQEIAQPFVKLGLIVKLARIHLNWSLFRCLDVVSPIVVSQVTSKTSLQNIYKTNNHELGKLL